jgi:hypothetical protein
MGGVDFHVAEFLANCRFAFRCEVRLWIQDYLWQPESKLALHSFLPFFHNTIARLMLIKLPAEAQAILAHEIVRIPSVHNVRSFPALELFRQDRLPRKLTLELNNLEPNSKESLRFWELIQELQSRARDHPTSTPCTIQVSDDVISWADEDREEDEEAFLQQLLPRAKELYKNKIHITDYLGHDCTMWRSRVVGTGSDAT